MSATTYWHDGSSFVNISGRLALEGWQLREDAEEGSAPTSVVSIADTSMDFAPVAFHPWHVLESTSTDDDDVLVSGFLWEPDLSRGDDVTFSPYARGWAQSLTDENHLWDRIAMKGSDNNRPAETDVQRIQWLLGTSEAAIFDDVTTYVHTAGPVAMDANDYTGQKLSDVMRDCSEASGKNWWAKTIRISGTLTLVVWYGRDSSTRYDSELGLSNDAADLIEGTLLDESSLVWPLGAETKVSRDYGRVYCGLIGQFEGGRTYRHNSTTHATYFAGPGPDMHRDTIAPMPNVKSLAKAQARGDRMLLDMATPDVRVTTKVRMPAALATKIRSGMRIPVKVTYDPELNTWTWCRILNCTVTPVAAGTEYDLDLDMTPTGDAGNAEPGPQGEFSGSAFVGLQDSNYGPTTLGFITDGDHPNPGWNANPTVGPLSVVDVAEPFFSLRADADITVRVYALAFFATVATNASATMNITSSVRGLLFQDVKTFTAGGLTFWTDQTLIDQHNVSLVAGEILTVSGSYTGFLTGGWEGVGVNNSSFRIGRGTQNWGSGGSAEVWVGP